MAIPLTQNQRWYAFCDLPKGQRCLQFVFRNDTNQPLCEMLVEVNKQHHDCRLERQEKKKRRRRIGEERCNCHTCMAEMEEPKVRCIECEPKYGECECQGQYHYDRPCSPRIRKIKVQTTFCADTVEWCHPSNKVMVSFEQMLYGKCIPFHYPNNVFLMTIELDQPLRKGDCIHVEPCHGYGAVRISE